MLNFTAIHTVKLYGGPRKMTLSEVLVSLRARGHHMKIYQDLSIIPQCQHQCSPSFAAMNINIAIGLL